MEVRYLRIMFALFLLLVPSLSALAGCQKMPHEYKEFFDLPYEQQRARLKSFPVDKQIEYHLAGSEYFHPPFGFTEEITSQGKEVVPPLAKRLKEEKLDHRRMILIDLFEYLHFSHYDLSNEKEVLDLLKNVAGRMEPSYSKDNAEKSVTNILENRRPSLERFKEERPEAFPKGPGRARQP